MSRDAPEMSRPSAGDRAAKTTVRLSAVALGLSAGAMLAEGGLLVPYWQSLPPQAFLAWYTENASRLLSFFGVLEGAATLSAIAAAVVGGRRPGVASRLISALLAIAVLVPFPLYFQEVNASFAEGTIPLERVAEELRRWSALHWARTAIGVGAFVAALRAVERTSAAG